MGGCEGCSYNQCNMVDTRDCVAVEGKSGEHKCVSNTCNNSEDCRKLLPFYENYECKDGTCNWFIDLTNDTLPASDIRSLN